MSEYLTPEQVCELIPGMKKHSLAQLRYLGGGPLFMKPTPKIVVYKKSDVISWLEAKQFERTDKQVLA